MRAAAGRMDAMAGPPSTMAHSARLNLVKETLNYRQAAMLGLLLSQRATHIHRTCLSGVTLGPYGDASMRYSAGWATTT